MPNHHDLPSASPRDDASEASIFDRFPRPQKVLEPIRLLVPTKAALLRACTDTQLLSPPGVLSTEKTRSAPPPPPTPPPVVRVHPDRTVSSQTFKRPLPLVKSAHESKNTEEAEPVSTIVLGYLTQDGVEWAISAKKQRSGNLSMKRGRSEVVLFMVKQLERHAGLRVERILEHINHRNIAKVTNLAWEDNRLFLGIEYCRFTLKEILHVHRKLEEPQIRYIACSMFNALSYLAQRGIVHHSIGLHSIRVVVDDFRIVLTDFESATMHETKEACNADLVDFGFVLWECMEGRALTAEKRHIGWIKDQRAVNKVFGFADPERWSGCKQLIDFMDELFNEQRTALAKFSKPHHYVSSNQEHPRCMWPYVELVSFECLLSFVPDFGRG